MLYDARHNDLLGYDASRAGAHLLEMDAGPSFALVSNPPAPPAGTGSPYITV